MRHIAVLFEPDGLDFRQRETVRGVARYAKGHGGWQVSLEPHGHLAEAPASPLPAAARRRQRGERCPVRQWL